MALIACPECGKDVSTRAVACPNCGCPINDGEQFQVQRDYININICMAKQTFLVSATVKIFLNDVEVGWVGDGQSTTIAAPLGENYLTFKASFRKTAVAFSAQEDVDISLKWNRITGTLEGLCTGSDVCLL